MSGFLLPRLRGLSPYVPGEQPRDMSYIKLNTNESPFPPSPMVLEALSRERIAALNLYPDPTCEALKYAIANEYGLGRGNVFVGNGSDEVLGFSFMAYTDETHPVTIPEVSYGFYKVYAALLSVKADIVPLREDYTIPAERFFGSRGMVALANPNAPTSLALGVSHIESIIAENRGVIVLIDEAYIDFGGESCLSLLPKYDNLLIVRTFSKSRSLAGGRLGYALASPEIIADLERVKSSFHPYSINSLTMAAGIAAINDRAYFDRCVEGIKKTRDESAKELRALGFSVPESATNFLFAAPPGLSGRRYYELLKRRGVLVRYLGGRTLENRVRISVGTREQMRALIDITKEILREVEP